MVRPLTKRDSEGVLYIRPVAVEAQVDATLAEDLATLRTRLAVADNASPDYVKSECLVHLIREAVRQGDQGRTNAVLTILLRRCEANLRVKIPDGYLPNAADIREEVLSRFSELFAADGADATQDELDYFECRFNRAFRTFRIDLVRSETTRLNHLAPLPDHTDDGEPEAYEDVFARVSDAFQTPATQESTLFLDALGKAINALPPDERKAVILCHVMGYKEESESPDQVTAATLCNCTGRTIRNRLTQAAKKLSRFKEEA